jgi:transketolase
VNIDELETEAALARLNVIRMVRAGKSGHLGGALSCIDIVTALYCNVMNIDPSEPGAPQRDRFLLSAGHKAMAQYAVLARRGFFHENLLDTYGALGSRLGGHPDMHKIPGVEANTGALGHGLAIACGIALGIRSTGRVFTILGDGELPEGSNWEGAAIAAHHQLGNLLVFVDVNGLQISGRTCDVMDMEPIGDKFAAFGWRVMTIDGNNMEEILAAVDFARLDDARPTVVIARTVKAKGIGFLEGTLASHYWNPSELELLDAEAELRGRVCGLREQD